MADQLWERAQCDLRVQIAGAPCDWTILEHSQRVARLAQAISQIPEIIGPPFDRTALEAASLYHDAGWVLQARDGEIQCRDMMLRPTSDLQRDAAADWMQIRLKDILGPGVLSLAARAVRQMNDRRTDMTEAQILAEAEALDDIGPTAIVHMMRKKYAEGKTLADVVAAWERQEEYHYWQARLKDGFRFAATRQLAQRRLEALRQFMTELKASIRFDDLPPSMATPSAAAPVAVR